MQFLPRHALPMSLALAVTSSALVALVGPAIRSPSTIQEYAFIEIATNLYRMSYSVKLIPGLLDPEISVFLVRDEEDFLLIDAGWPGEGYRQILMPALKGAIKGGTLRLILLTHG